MRGLASLFLLASALVVTPIYSQDGAQLKGPKGVDYGVQGRSIGPIKPTDTLWRIAAKIRPDNSVSIYQVMQALYEKNPQSFLDQNLNHMRDGAYLKIPTLTEIQGVSPELAKQRSEQDDELWEKKKNGTLTKSEINASQKKVTQARKVDVDEAKQELKQEINSIKTQQGTQLVELQKQFKSSVNNVEEILVENNKLKQQLTGVSKELENIREQLGQDSEIQRQLKELITKQNEIIEQQNAKKLEETSEFDFAGLLANPLVLILLMTIPALLVIFAIVMFLRKRNNKQDDDEFLPQSPSYTADEDIDLGPSLDPIIPDPVPGDIDDLSVQLDDDDKDILPDDDDIIFDDNIDDEFEDGDSLLNQDELNGLLSDDIVFDDEHKEQDDELDIFMQQDFDKADDDSLGDDIDLDMKADADDGDILSAADLDDLFANDVEQPATAEADDSLDSDDDLAALSEELADDDFDIDALIDEQSSNKPAEPELASEDDEFDLDDIDGLIDEAASDTSKAEPELVEEDDEFDLDDIDSLIDETAAEDVKPEPVEEDDEFDLDDI
ncbi:MAG: FimV/HubP family polar landmark protein, partial [Pseudoalteromonas prydzensis]